MMAEPLYIYTETAFHHEGNYDFMISLIDESKKAGVNGVKFQVLMDLDNLTSSKHTAYPTLKQYVFTAAQWLKIIEYAQGIGLDVIMMPLDIESLVLLNTIKKPKYLEIHPVCFYDQNLISEMKKTNVPIIVGVGGRTEDEIQEITKRLGSQLEVLMVGFQSFPSKLEDVKLKKIQSLKAKYPALSIGYADHSSYSDDFSITSNEYALLFGAKIFEKHITINEGVERVDYVSALNGDRLKHLVSKLHFLNDNILTVSEEQLNLMDEPELIYRNRQKVFVAKTDLKKNHTITKEDVVMKMINKEGGFSQVNELIGAQLSENVEKDDVITKNHLHQSAGIKHHE